MGGRPPSRGGTDRQGWGRSYKSTPDKSFDAFGIRLQCVSDAISAKLGELISRYRLQIPLCNRRCY